MPKLTKNKLFVIYAALSVICLTVSGIAQANTGVKLSPVAAVFLGLAGAFWAGCLEITLSGRRPR